MVGAGVEFPSPPGTSYFLVEGKTQKDVTKVSVPSGDFLFSSKNKKSGEITVSGFRPLRGLLIF